MELRSGHVALSAASTPPQGEEPQALAESAISLGPSTLPSQLSASEALRMLDAVSYTHLTLPTNREV